MCSLVTKDMWNAFMRHLSVCMILSEQKLSSFIEWPLQTQHKGHSLHCLAISQDVLDC